ncbi:hypothetical protein ABMA28_012570 [Loxostege sticticalis]|uniref:C2H2-type domain-containing protein n=1 Tax=Loxostege sticticalis TaxID=481309 RepID=A0ABD0S497_LOXSC
MESVCVVCQANTDLVPLGEFEKLYELLAGTNKFEDEKLSTCLSCQDFFRKIQEFQRKIQSSQDVFLCDFCVQDNNADRQVKQEADEFKYEDYDFLEEHFTNEEVQTPESPDIKINKFEIDVSSQSLNDNNRNNTDSVLRETNVKNKQETVKLTYIENKKPWSVKQIEDFIKKHDFPYDIQYVKKLLEYRNVKYKVIHGKELYENSFDAVVETQVFVDDSEVKELIQRSRRQRHFTSRKISCKKCVLVFNSKKKLRKHVEDNHEKTIGQFICEFCETRTASKESLETHRQTHYIKYVCKLCQHVECSKEQMFHHFKAKRKMLQCLQCLQLFGDTPQLQHHYKAAHMTYTCDHCQRTFHDRLWFEKHVISYHLPNRCRHCQKVYRNHARLQQHVRMSHAELEPTYCVECDKTYPDRVRYRSHVYTQHGPRKPGTRLVEPTYCVECDKTYPDRVRYRSHVYTQHGPRKPGTRSLFVSKYHLQRHIAAVHEKVPKPKNKICTHCGRGFSTRRILTHHIRTHTGERPFVCAVCDAAFAQKGALRTHLKRHVK